MARERSDEGTAQAAGGAEEEKLVVRIASGCMHRGGVGRGGGHGVR